MNTKLEQDFNLREGDMYVDMEPRVQFCVSVTLPPQTTKELFVWTKGARLRDPTPTHDVEYLLRWIDCVRYDVVEVPWKMWLGSIGGRHQISIGTSRPQPQSADDKIGKQIAKGTWAELFPIFCQYVRMI